MTTRTIPSRLCYKISAHPAHEWLDKSTYPSVDAHCPGRVTTLPADPFAGIDESTEFDATRPAVS